MFIKYNDLLNLRFKKKLVINTLYFTEKGVYKAINDKIFNLYNLTLTELTKAQIGLANVDNTSDLNKPISIATQTVINEVEDNVVAYSIALGGV